jgi:hypothetical protein
MREYDQNTHVTVAVQDGPLPQQSTYSAVATARHNAKMSKKLFISINNTIIAAVPAHLFKPALGKARASNSDGTLKPSASRFKYHNLVAFTKLLAP